jgi:D-beta-D-heptose 7-phosphate kinase/D-beta-D-heptose 1-phosphate adenosyltransferase
VRDADSAWRIEGAGRPITGVESRMAVLVSLPSVDWTCPFSEHTRRDITCRVWPEIPELTNEFYADRSWRADSS